MKIVVVVLNWNGEKFISRCLTSLIKLDKGNHEVEIIVVDNKSTDGSAKLIKKQFPQVRLIINSQNLGYSGGNNVGMLYAKGQKADWVWIVNPDVQVKASSLVTLVEKAKTNPKYAALGSKVYFASGYEFHKEKYSKSDFGKVLWFAGGAMDWNNITSINIGIDEVDTGKYDQVKEVEFLTGSSMLISLSVIDEIGMYDPKYFLYYEETDFCQRVLRAGYKLVYVPQSVVWHANAQSTVAGSGLVDYYTTRNRMLLGMRWAPIKSKLALLRESLRLSLTGRQWQKRGILDFYLHRFGKGSYA